MALDENNLYGWAMTRPLPCDEFKLIKPDEIDKIRQSTRTMKSSYMKKITEKLIYGVQRH